MSHITSGEVSVIKTKSCNEAEKTGFWIMLILFFGVGCFIYFDFDKFPGDLGDTRFNMYVLEHCYRWLSGLEKNFWKTHFFYSAKNALVYSDVHIKTIPYAYIWEFLFYRRRSFSGIDIS